MRQFALACASVALAACAGSSDGPPEPVSEGFYGAAVGDEPRAVLTARDVLTAGGDAVDAAVAYYFAAAVTYPAAASLGAGGACVVYDAEANRAEALEFLPPLTAEAPPGMRAVAVPGLARGLYALHSRYSRLRFEQLVAPAEALARLGHRVSRALAVDIDVAGEALMAEPGMREAFGGRGAGLGEGEDFVQIDLGATLTQIRSRGVGALYTGALARRLVDGASAVGAALDAGALQAFAPVWRATAELEVGYAVAHVPPPPTTAAVSSLAVFAMTVSAPAAEGPAGAAHVAIEAGLRALADRATWPGGAAAALDPDHLASLMASYRADAATDPAALPNPPSALRENPSGSGFAAVDRDGSAVACAVTMNNLFGAARIAQTTGILLSGARRLPTLSLVPVIVVNHNSREVLFAGAATGGVAAAPTMAAIMTNVLERGQPIAAAVAAPRVVHFGNPNVVVPEPGLAEGVLQELRAIGHDLTEPYGLARVHGIACPLGLRSRPESCAAVADPRGHGLAVGG